MQLTFNQCKRLFAAIQIYDYALRLQGIYKATCEYTEKLAGEKAAAKYSNTISEIMADQLSRSRGIKNELQKELACYGEEWYRLEARFQNRYESICARYIIRPVHGNG